MKRKSKQAASPQRGRVDIKSRIGIRSESKKSKGSTTTKSPDRRGQQRKARDRSRERSRSKDTSRRSNIFDRLEKNAPGSSSSRIDLRSVLSNKRPDVEEKKREVAGANSKRTMVVTIDNMTSHNSNAGLLEPVPFELGSDNQYRDTDYPGSRFDSHLDGRTPLELPSRYRKSSPERRNYESVFHENRGISPPGGPLLRHEAPQSPSNRYGEPDLRQDLGFSDFRAQPKNTVSYGRSPSRERMLEAHRDMSTNLEPISFSPPRIGQGFSHERMYGTAPRSPLLNSHDGLPRIERSLALFLEENRDPGPRRYDISPTRVGASPLPYSGQLSPYSRRGYESPIRPPRSPISRRSPSNRYGYSPAREISPVRRPPRLSPSPSARRQGRSPSPLSRPFRALSPYRGRSRSPRLSPPSLRRSISPLRRTLRSPSPLRRPLSRLSPLQRPMRSLSPLRRPLRSPSPLRRPLRSPSPLRRPLRSPSPLRRSRRDPSPLRRPLRSPPLLRRDPSPLRRPPRGESPLQHRAEVTCKICHNGHATRLCPDLFCKKCEKAGHFTNECPDYPQVTCFDCKGPHLTRFCPEKRANPLAVQRTDLPLRRPPRLSPPPRGKRARISPPPAKNLPPNGARHLAHQQNQRQQKASSKGSVRVLPKKGQQPPQAKSGPSAKKIKGKTNHLIADLQRQEIEALMRQQMRLVPQPAPPPSSAPVKPPAQQERTTSHDSTLSLSSEDDKKRCSLSPVSNRSSISLSDAEEEICEKEKPDSLKKVESRAADKVKFTINEFEEILDYGHGSGSEDEVTDYEEKDAEQDPSKTTHEDDKTKTSQDPDIDIKLQKSVEQSKTDASADNQTRPLITVENEEKDETTKVKCSDDLISLTEKDKSKKVGSLDNPVNLEEDDDDVVVVCEDSQAAYNLYANSEVDECPQKDLQESSKRHKNKKVVDLRSLLNKKKAESVVIGNPVNTKQTEKPQPEKAKQQPPKVEACWYCGSPNHTQVKCITRKKNGHPMVAKPMCPADSENSENYCVNCSVTGHKLRNCPGFIRMDPAERWEVTNKSGLICVKCLNYGHMVEECDSYESCLFEGCWEHHHTLLHNPDDVDNTENRNFEDNAEEFPYTEEQPAEDMVPQEEDEKKDSIQNMLTHLRRQVPVRVNPARESKQQIQIEICKICKDNHHVSKCPDLFCKKCEQKGHFTLMCPNYPKVTCFICKEPHLTRDCKNKPAQPKCRTCMAWGHKPQDCPDRQYTCVNCQGSHHIKNCPDLVCKKCGEAGHSPQFCPKELTEPCSNCQGNHHPINCRSDENNKLTCHQCQGNHHIKDCPSALCKKCDEVGHWISTCPKSIKCFKCEIFGHHIQNCPFVECKNCGAYGHWIQACTNRKNEFRRRKVDLVEEENSKKVISIDYHHIGGPKPGVGAQNVVPQSDAASNSKPLMTHFYEKLIARGRNPELASQMMLYWRLAEHSEQSLRALFYKHSPCSRDTLRLLLVSELANAPSSCRPMDVTSSDLLDETIDYFMPRTTSVSDFSKDLSMSAQMTHQFFRNQNQGAAASAGPSTSAISYPLDSAAEGRYKSLQPLQDYIAKKMRSLSSMFGIQEAYIMEVSTTIQRLLAEVGLCLFTLRRHFTTFGKESLGENIMDKISSSKVKLPERVSPSYVVAIVSDFLGDYCK